MNSSKNIGTYKIPSDLMAEFDDVPDSDGSGKTIMWTKEQDALIVALWRKKKHREFVKAFRGKYGCGSKSSLSERYEFLTKKFDYRGPDEYKLLAPE